MHNQVHQNFSGFRIPKPDFYSQYHGADQYSRDSEKLITFVDRKRNAPVTRKGVNVTGERAGKPPYFELQAMNDDSDGLNEGSVRTDAERGYVKLFT